MAGLFNFGVDKPQLKLARGRLSQQGKDFLRTLSWYDADNVQKLYYEKFGVTYNKGTLLKYVPSEPTASADYTADKQSINQIFTEGEIHVDDAGLWVTDKNENSVMINLELFTPTILRQLSAQILHLLEDELREEESKVEKLRARFEAIKTITDA